jgi:hypothetical protein
MFGWTWTLCASSEVVEEEDCIIVDYSGLAAALKLVARVTVWRRKVQETENKMYNI